MAKAPAVPLAAPGRAAVSGEGAAYAAAVLAVLGWGSLYPAAKPVLREVTPLMVAFDRAALACLTLTALTCLKQGSLTGGLRHLAGQWRASGWWIVVAGVISFSGTSILAMTAQQLLPASVNGLLNNLSPLWLALFAAVTGRAHSAAYLLAGSTVAVGGVAAVLFGNAGQQTSTVAAERFLVGAGIALAGSVLIAYSNTLVRRVMAGRDPLALTAIGAGCGAVPLLVPLLFGLGGSLPAFGQTTVTSRWLLLWLGTVSTAFNFALWNYALAHLPVTRVANFAYLIPPLGVVLAVVFLKEPAGWALLAGTVAIVAGIALAQRGAEPPRGRVVSSAAPH